MPVNIYDVAKKAGVSVVTVSRVLNNSPKVRANNRQKVLTAIADLDYQPNAVAQSLARGSTGMVGLILPTVFDPFMAQVLASVEGALRDKGMFLVTSFAADDLQFGKANSVRLFRENRVDGILILSPLKNDALFLELKKNNFPFVLLDQHHSHIQASSVTVDNYYGGYQATNSLITAGAKRIGHIFGSGVYESTAERLNGYKQALLDHNIAVDEALLAPGDFTIYSGYKITKEWIIRGILPQAIFAADDNTAFGVIDAARKFRIAVPEKLAIIGYDDHPFASLLHPALSTVRQPTEELGRQGVELLSSLISGKIKRTTTIILKPEIVLRESTLSINNC
ncbi:HTH-type transcriptional regulator DegA [Peptococcaceae bacterium CEB3]|nr:HTH-type transcriptional regulator DegA [Peptococcaceae bacterium CEB3]